MKTTKIIAAVMAVTMIGSALVGCGNDTGSSTTDNKASVTDTTSDTTSTTEYTTSVPTETTTETDTDTKTVTNAGSTAAALNAKLPDTISFTDTASFTAKEVGKYETYLDGFNIPSNMVMISTAADNIMTVAHANDMVMLDMDVTMTDDETKEEQNLCFTMYTDGKKMWSITSADGETLAQTATIESEENNALGDFDEESDISNTKFTYDSYLGEETIDGTTYDVISCKVDTEGLDDTKLYFDKDGGFCMLSTEKDGCATVIREIKEISIPDEKWEDASAEELGSTMLSAIFAFAFSGAENLSETDVAISEDGENIASETSEAPSATTTSEATAE